MRSRSQPWFETRGLAPLVETKEQGYFGPIYWVHPRIKQALSEKWREEDPCLS